MTVDYDVPIANPEATAALMLRGSQLEAKLAQAASTRLVGSRRGFSAVALRGDAMPSEEAEIVVHVPSLPGGAEHAAALLADAKRQLGVLHALAEEQRAQEDEALRVAKRAVAQATVNERSAKTTNETVAEVEATSSRDGSLRRALGELGAEVEAGGATARRALKSVLPLAADPATRANVASSAVVRAAEVLLQRPSTDEANRALAGSLLTLLSGAPLTAEVSNEATGADGHLEIVLPRPSRMYGPDAMSMQLSAGVPPSRIMS